MCGRVEKPGHAGKRHQPGDAISSTPAGGC
jgi:hypothetical protein